MNAVVSGDGSIRADATTADVIVQAAMLAQPLPNTGHWDPTARCQKTIFLDGLSTLPGGRTSPLRQPSHP